MKDLIFLAADVWLIVVGFWFGWKFIRNYGNYLLGLECLVVGVSASNFLIGSLLGAAEGGIAYDISFFLDAFSRSVGFTLILVLGLMAVTHRYKPTIAVEIGVFALAIVVALFLRKFHDETLHIAPATFYVVANLLTTLFLVYFANRLWDSGARRLAIWTGLVTAAASVIAITYDFFPLPFDDQNRTFFYTAALTTWGAQGVVYFLGYRSLHSHNMATDAEPSRSRQGGHRAGDAMKPRNASAQILAAAAVAMSVASICAAPAAKAEPTGMPPQVYDKISPDGWHLHLQIKDEVVNSVPNLAAAANSREAFVTATATATAAGGQNPIQDSLFILGYQLGCQSDVSAGLALGGTAGIAGSVGLPQPSIGGSAGAAGFVETIVQPGVIVDLPMTNMALSAGNTASLGVDNLHVKADACGGDVNIRSYAYLRISTPASHFAYAVYGDPIKI